MKVGDKVRVKSDLEFEVEYDDAAYFIEEMVVFLGKEAIITKVLYENESYGLDIDKQHEFSFTNSMLDLIESV